MQRYVAQVPTMATIASVGSEVDVLNEFVAWLSSQGYAITGPDGPIAEDETAAAVDVFMASTRGLTFSTWRDLQVPLHPTGQSVPTGT